LKPEDTVFVAGHRGLVGSALLRQLKQKDCPNLILKTHSELDLLDQHAVKKFFKSNQIDYVFLAAAKVGGILANQRQQADFLYENLMIACNVIHAAANYSVKKLLFLGSFCIYPKFSKQPIEESSLLTRPLEESNEGYAISKIAGLKLCEMYRKQYKKDFISAMPTNLYGINDNFHPEHSHVIPGLMKRIHNAKIQNKPSVTIWGTGSPKREFLHVDDLAKALFFLMGHYSDDKTINIGTGKDITIKRLAGFLVDIIGYKGDLLFDSLKPDGTPRKVLDVGRINRLGWESSIKIKDGLSSTYNWCLQSEVFS